jgi:hypothetical protein
MVIKATSDITGLIQMSIIQPRNVYLLLVGVSLLFLVFTFSWQPSMSYSMK